MQTYLLFIGLVLAYHCYFESIFVCVLLIKADVTFCRYRVVTFARTTKLKNLIPTKTLEVPY